MASRDTSVIGFSEADARQIIAGLEVGSREVKEHGRRGGSGGKRFFVFRLNEAWTAGVADSDIYTVNGVTITDTGIDADVYDPLSMFTALGIDDYGWCFRQAGLYYAIQAPCPA